jgi:hypothetical protein
MFNPLERNARQGNGDLPVGRHLVTVTRAGLFVSKAGKEAVEVTFEVADPSSPHRGRRHDNEKFWLTEAAAHRLVNLCLACDPDFPEFDERNDDEVHRAFVGRRVAVQIAAARKADAFRPVEAVGFDALTDAELELLGPAPAQAAPPAPRSPARPASTAPTLPPNDDDIPF